MKNKSIFYSIVLLLVITLSLGIGCLIFLGETNTVYSPNSDGARKIDTTASIINNTTSDYLNRSGFNTAYYYTTATGYSLTLQGATVNLQIRVGRKESEDYLGLSGSTTYKSEKLGIGQWGSGDNTKCQYCYTYNTDYFNASGSSSMDSYNDAIDAEYACTHTTTCYGKSLKNSGTVYNTSYSANVTVSNKQVTTTFYCYTTGGTSLSTTVTRTGYYRTKNTSNPCEDTSIAGYTVAGIYENSTNSSSQVYNTTEDIINNGQTYYILYTSNTYQINYNLDGGSEGENHPTTGTYGSIITISNPTRTGYHFTGWTLTRYSSTAQSGTRRGLIFYRYTWYDYDGSPTTRLYFRNLQTTAGGKVTFTANWEINTYKVRFNANGGSGTMSDQSFTYGTSQNLTKNSFTRAGHTFAGWNTKADGSGTPYSDSASVNNLTTTNNATVTLYAQWTTQNLLANFNYNGGTVVKENDSQPYSSNGTYLSKIPPKKDMSRTGYTFKGWSLTRNDTGKYYDSTTDWNNVKVSNVLDDNKEVCISDAGVGNIEFTLYAIWEANEYKINYNLPGGSPGSSHPTTAKYDSVVNISNPTKKGYTFTGWTASGLSNTAKSGVSNSLSALKTWNGSATKNTYFANLTADPGTVQNGVQIAYATVTLTANWTANTYTINYSLGDNTSFPATLGSKAPKSATYNVAIEISTPTRVGYVFAGWILSGNNISTAQSGASSTNLSAWDGGVNRNRYFKNLTPNASGSVTMTATWQATIASSSPSITATKPAKDSNNEYYLISNINNLAWLALQGDKEKVTGKFRQTNNITIPNNILWLPIGRLGSFSGTYDGQGNTIRGLTTYNGTDVNGNYLEANGGLFANASGATITNVIIEDATIYGQNAGIIAGSASTNNTGSSTNISNCVVSGTIKGTNAGSIIGNGNGASITACLAKGVNTASFAGVSASVDSCIYELNDPSKTKGRSSTFTKYSEWIYPSNFGYPMPKAFMWYPYPELSEDSLNKWLGL